MEVKKTEKANLENRRLLFTEIGLVAALLVVWGAFSYGTKEKTVAMFETDTEVVEVEEMVPITQETPPPPPEAPQIPVLSDQIDIVEDDIKVEDNFMSLEDDANLGVEIMDYVEEVKEEVVEEEAIPFQLVEEKPSFNGGDANEFSKWVNSKLVYPEIAKENGVQGRVTLQFTVEKDGSVTNVKVLRGVDSSLDKEAVRNLLGQTRVVIADYEISFHVPVTVLVQRRAQAPAQVYRGVRLDELVLGSRDDKEAVAVPILLVAEGGIERQIADSLLRVSGRHIPVAIRKELRF